MSRTGSDSIANGIVGSGYDKWFSIAFIVSYPELLEVEVLILISHTIFLKKIEHTGKYRPSKFRMFRGMHAGSLVSVRLGKSPQAFRPESCAILRTLANKHQTCEVENGFVK